MRIGLTLLAVGALFLGACNSYSLRYAAQPQPSGAPLFADYVRLDDTVAVTIDTDNLRLQDVYIKKADGTVAHPQSIASAQPARPAPLSASLGFGTEHDATNNVAYGTGMPVPTSPARSDGLARATFSAAEIGPAPWELHVKVEGVPEATIPGLGAVPTAK